MDNNLEAAIAELRKDGVKIEVEEKEGGEQVISIETKRRKLILSVNGLGTWLKRLEPKE